MYGYMYGYMLYMLGTGALKVSGMPDAIAAGRYPW